MKVEVCANSYESAINAEKAGANRIELCSELAVGGITPSYGLINKVIEDISIPVNILVRPRSGNFTYSEAEFEIMKRDILLCKKLKCNGIVSGILKKDQSIDIKRTRELVEIAKPLSFTFHRAIDWVENPFKAIESLVDLGIQRVLTSGQEISAVKGINLLKNLHNKYEHKLVIMPGGGININNIIEFKNTGFKEVHFSATTLQTTIDPVKVKMNSHRFFDETQISISDLNLIKTMVDLVK